LALKLFLALSAEKKADDRFVVPYLDQQCLNDGEDWELGFLYGLQGAAVCLLLISDDGLKRIEKADEYQDNVLLEYEKALEKMDAEDMIVLPLLIGKTVDGGLYKKFSNFPGTQYPEKKHASAKSTTDLNVRETMQKLFKLQGIAVNPEAFQDKMKDIISKIDEALKKFDRLGDVKEVTTWQDKYASDWTIADIQKWLKDSGFAEYKDAFKENAIDGKMLLSLDEKTLSEDLKVTKRLHLLKFKSEIEALKTAEAADDEEEDDEDDDDEGDDDDGGDDDGGDDDDDDGGKKKKKKGKKKKDDDEE